MPADATEEDVRSPTLPVRSALFWVAISGCGSMKGRQDGHAEDAFGTQVRIRKQEASAVVVYYINIFGERPLQTQPEVAVVFLRISVERGAGPLGG